MTICSGGWAVLRGRSGGDGRDRGKGMLGAVPPGEPGFCALVRGNHFKEIGAVSEFHLSFDVGAEDELGLLAEARLGVKPVDDLHKIEEAFSVIFAVMVQMSDLGEARQLRGGKAGQKTQVVHVN